jgi:hypothetical protein
MMSFMRVCLVRNEGVCGDWGTMIVIHLSFYLISDEALLSHFTLVSPTFCVEYPLQPPNHGYPPLFSFFFICSMRPSLFGAYSRSVRLPSATVPRQRIDCGKTQHTQNHPPLNTSSMSSNKPVKAVNPIPKKLTVGFGSGSSNQSPVVRPVMQTIKHILLFLIPIVY